MALDGFRNVDLVLLVFISDVLSRFGVCMEAFS